MLQTSKSINYVILQHTHKSIYGVPGVNLSSKMSSENVSLKSIDEMWKVIESSGIKREVFEKHNPSFAEIKELYLFLKQRDEPLNSQKKINK